MAFPSTTPTKVHMDQSTDSPALARSELATLVDLVTQIIQSYGQVDGVCDLDSSGAVPSARLPSGTLEANTANSLTTPRTIAIGGDLTTASPQAFDGTSDITISAQVNNDSHSHTASTLPSASTSAKGVVELATTSEASAGTDSTRAVTSAGVKAAVGVGTSKLAVYAVGSYIFAWEEVKTVITNPGGTRAGSYLRPSNTIENTTYGSYSYGSGMAGTWRCMGYSYNQDYTGGESGDPEMHSATLWLRIS